MYFAWVANKDRTIDGKTVNLENTLFLFTGMNQVPPFGLPNVSKNVMVLFLTLTAAEQTLKKSWLLSER